MKVLITDSELTAYAEGRLSDAEIHALEQKAIKTGQADLLLSVIIAQHSIDMELSREYWGHKPHAHGSQSDKDSLLSMHPKTG